GDLVEWAQSAPKADIAALAKEVFWASARHDKIASDILASAAHSLAKDAANCAQRLLGGRDAVSASVKSGSATRRPSHNHAVQFVLAGSVLLKQPRFAGQVADQLKQLWPGAVVTPLKRESAWG